MFLFRVKFLTSFSSIVKIPHLSIQTQNVGLTHVKKVLKNNGVLYTDGYTCIKIKECQFCNQIKKKSSDILVNKTTGHFLCEECKHTGTWNILERLITETKKNKNLSAKEILALKDGSTIYDKTSANWKLITEENQSLTALQDSEVTEIFNSFNLTLIPRTIYDKLHIYCDKERTTLYFPLMLPNNKIVGYKTINKLTNKVTTTPRQNCAGSIVVNSRKRDTAILVPTVQDLFALLSQNLSTSIICLPYGVSTLPQSLIFFLESYEKLIIWFGFEVGASDAARLFVKKLNDKRSYLVMSTDKQYSPSIAVNNQENIKKIISSAQQTWHQAITTFTSLREAVFSELQNVEQVQGVKWIKYPMLNKILKGHRRGELTVLTGPTGSGKTTFMSEYSLDLAMQGVNTLWGSFEIRNERLARTMLQQFAEIPLDEKIEEFDKWADLFEQLPIYFMTFHGQQSVSDVMNAVEHAFYIHDIAHVIIDNVQFMMGVADDSKFVDRFWKQDHIIQSFRRFATDNNCHVTLVIHPRKEKEAEDLTTSSIFGGAKASQEADNILLIQDKRLTSIKGKKYLQIAKNRYTGDLGIMPLEFNKSSLSYAQKKKKSPEVLKEDLKFTDTTEEVKFL